MIINESQSTEQHPHLPIGCSVHGGGSRVSLCTAASFVLAATPRVSPGPSLVVLCSGCYFVRVKKHFAEYTILVVYNSPQKSIKSLEKSITPY